MKKFQKIISLVVGVFIMIFFFTLTSPNIYTNGSVTTITDSKIENIINPIGIDVLKPRFSWKIKSETIGQLQKKYQIIVSTTTANLADNVGDAWNSGLIKSSHSIGVEYQGSALLSRQIYYWKVNVWDKDGNKLTSENSYFEMGLLDKALWDAKFISLDKAEQLEGNSAPMYRKDFTLSSEKTVQSARLYASALGVYDAYINGKRVSQAALSPGYTDYKKYVMYQTYDVTNMINSSNNTIGAIVGNGWYAGHISNSKNLFGVDVAFLGQLEVTYTDGSRQIIGTDNTWKATENGPYVITDNQNGETYDATKEFSGWSEPGFNSSEWHNTKIALKSTINTKVDIENIKYIAQIGPLVMPQDEFSAKAITEPTPGTYIIDIGQNIAGWARLTIKGGKAGDKIRIRYGEMLFDERAGALKGTLYTDNLRTAKATDYYIKKGNGDEIYEPRFTFHGFQYIEVTGYPGVLKADDVKGIFVGSDTNAVGTYNTSNTMVNKLFSNLTWSQRDNFLSIPTDCPQRDERSGWTGDVQIFARTSTYNMDVNQFYKKYILDLKSAQLGNGAITDVAPIDVGTPAGGNAGWADVGIILPWTMYLTYGDKQILTDSYDMMKKQVNYYKTLPTASEPFIIPNCAYGDWLALEPTGKDLVATAYFAYSTNLLAKAAKVLGNTSDAKEYNQLLGKIKVAFNKKFVTASTGRILGNSQTAYLLALKMDLLPTQQIKDMAIKNLVERISSANYHLTTGFLGVNALCPVLTESGYADVAYKLLLNETFPSWGYSVANGATSIWESWNAFSKEDKQSRFGFSNASLNHYSYGSIGEWMYRYSAGIEVDESAPAFKNTIFQPEVGGDFTFVNSSYNSVYGLIESNWTHNDTSFNYNITVPANTTGTVKLPTNTLDNIKINGVAYIPGRTNVNGVQYVKYENGKAIFYVKSGGYSFTSEIK